MSNTFKIGDEVTCRYTGYPTLTCRAEYEILNTDGDWCWVIDDEGDAYRARYPLYKHATQKE